MEQSFQIKQPFYIKRKNKKEMYFSHLMPSPSPWVLDMNSPFYVYWLES